MVDYVDIKVGIDHVVIRERLHPGFRTQAQLDRVAEIVGRDEFLQSMAPGICSERPTPP